MRYILFCLTVCTLSIGMSSCKKCWECEVTVTNPTNGQTVTQHTEICDATQKEIREAERAGTGTTTVSGMSFNSKTTCTPKR